MRGEGVALPDSQGPLQLFVFVLLAIQWKLLANDGLLIQRRDMRHVYMGVKYRTDNDRGK
jgi:hypothetical protein